MLWSKDEWVKKQGGGGAIQYLTVLQYFSRQRRPIMHPKIQNKTNYNKLILYSMFYLCNQVKIEQLGECGIL